MEVASAARDFSSRVLKKSKQQIPYRRKSLPDDKNKEPGKAELKLRRFKNALDRVFQQTASSTATWGSPESRAFAILSYAILLGGIVTICVTAHLVVVTYSGLPYDDGWLEAITVAQGYSALNPAWLWVQHNEHRLVIPKIFLAADVSLFRAKQVFLLISIFLIQFLHLTLLGWSMRVLGGWRRALWRTGLGLTAFCLFCPSQWENFVWGFQVCFVLPSLLATLSFIGLLLYWMDFGPSGKRRSWTLLLVANLAALGATYSLANGNLLWPILVAAAISLRLRLRAVLSFVITGTVSSSLYLVHYVRPRWHADPLSSMKTPVRLAEYLTGYFGSSWFWYGLRWAAPVGLAGLVVALVVILQFSSYVRRRRAFALQLVLTLLFCGGTAFITGLGRLNFGPGQSFSSRYQTFALLFWCCLGLMWLQYATAMSGRRIFLIAVQICLLAIMVRGALRVRSPITDARVHGFRLNQTAMSLMTGVPDEEQFKLAMGVTPRQVAAEIRYLRSKRLSVFSSDAYRQLDTRLASTFRLVAAEGCRGEVDSAAPLEVAGLPALAIRGWAWDNTHRRPPMTVVAAANGVITGLATVGDGRPDIPAANPDVNSDFVGFAGYVHNMLPFTPLKIYAVLSGSPPEACYIATVEPSATR